MQRELTSDAPETAYGGAADTADGEPADGIDGGLWRAAAYVREHDPSEIARDAWKIARDYPVPSTLIVTGLMIGATVGVAKLVRHDERSGGTSQRAQSLYAAAAAALGPHTPQIVRMRDAFIALMLAKAVSAIEERLPGFREHFDKA